MGWKCKDSQNLRFSKLLQVLLYEDRLWGGVSINDLGCGYGALYEFIKMNNMCLSKYFGYDIFEEMIEAANEFILNNNQEKDCEIFLENSSLITHYADYSITSGIFNMIFDEQEL